MCVSVLAGGETIFITLKICIKYLSQMVGRLYGWEKWGKNLLNHSHTLRPAQADGIWCLKT